jgi:hypothetical protein
MKPVSIDELLDQLRVNHEMTTIVAVGEIEFSGHFRRPSAVRVHPRTQDARPG